jgi:hypothetical protein
MGLFNWSKKSVNTTSKENWVQVDANGHFYHHIQQFFKGNTIRKFENCRSFHFASNLGEIFIPIDAIAERVSKIEYRVFNKNTDKEVDLPKALTDLINRPNPINSFSELVYQIQFSELASGGSYVVSKMPSSFKTKSYDRIVNIWVLNPDCTEANVLRSIPDPLMVRDLSELIKDYKTHWLVDLYLDPSEVNFNTISRLDSSLNPISPLESVERNINNLLAVYSARYNVYEKNGVAGIVYKDTNNNTNLEEQINPVTRQEVLDDIQSREGITGDRNFTGISRFKLGFIDTLGKIKDLEPFKETYADTIVIGGAYGVDKELLPKEDSTTFTNKKDAEKNLYVNTIIPYSYDIAKTLTKVFYLPMDWEFRPILDNIEILNDNRLDSVTADKTEIENLTALQTLGVNIDKRLDKWRE